ncbi:MAG TPA: AbrB/MazE/SpoVT family DNA-binding domain-containing protein [Chthoniobacterales bacterium]|nr:AbrB/MazE/SpoVT family DNA-binding domain-containing protein [Chthoniobacterales bacterium]
MKHWDTMAVSKVGQSTLPKWWRDVCGLSFGGVVEVRPLEDGKNSIVLTPRSSNRRGVSGKELMEQFASCPRPLRSPDRHHLPFR